ncbi:MAG: polyphosphate polymerase domain-containing protein [Mogibacterium sp.]|nr:polyphosphate polymerase domain-containing protein [Mogibacterium sp.]
MKSYQQVFRRIEVKYLMNEEQYTELRFRMAEHMKPDRYGKTEILNIYYDTPDHRLIRESLAAPVYKEKLRLRSYGIPDSGSPAFIELKKKYKGVVYKRRIDMSYDQAQDYLRTRIAPEVRPEDLQIRKEIDYFFRIYPELAPQMVLSYDRIALAGTEDPEFRVTFDSNIRWRDNHLDLKWGNGGEPLLLPGQRLMEVKCAGGMPLWLSRDLSELGIVKTSFSKYGRAYEAALLRDREAGSLQWVPSRSGYYKQYTAPRKNTAGKTVPAMPAVSAAAAIR